MSCNRGVGRWSSYFCYETIFLASCLLACELEVLSSVFSFFLSVVIFQRLNPNPIKMGPRLVRQ